ncbi:MAG: hypothetical protein HY305_03805 [Sphingobacteriales bacterium]|nr:hypothetical protein [Sphingobacteriales bacterium]
MQGNKAMEVLQYKSAWATTRIYSAFDSIEKRSIAYQRGLLELVYTLYPLEFTKQVRLIFNQPANNKILAMSAEYLFQAKAIQLPEIKNAVKTYNKNYEQDAVLYMLIATKENTTIPSPEKIRHIFNTDFLKGNRVIYSIQRKNRNYQGLAIVRDSTGNFIRDSNSYIIAIPQLARSISNLPCYLTNGNTPQGIFRMSGLDTSLSSYIGPTPNIQLTIPFETSLKHFLKDTTIIDSIWTENWYNKLLPKSLHNYLPAKETYYAGKAGRSEIIAHGTTVDPEYYKNQMYYPYTPTQGCLCSKETWSGEDGSRTTSDQQLLVNTIQAAGGADGYFIVLEIDDQQQPVSIEELLPYLINQK